MCGIGKSYQKLVDPYPECQYDIFFGYGRWDDEGKRKPRPRHTTYTRPCPKQKKPPEFCDYPMEQKMDGKKNCKGGSSCTCKPKMVPVAFFLGDNYGPKDTSHPCSPKRRAKQAIPENGMFFRPFFSINVDFCPPPKPESDDW